jgi:hypothetical protein
LERWKEDLQEQLLEVIGKGELELMVQTCLRKVEMVEGQVAEWGRVNALGVRDKREFANKVEGVRKEVA